MIFLNIRLLRRYEIRLFLFLKINFKIKLKKGTSGINF
nr:MAG TPA: hypothetical protein [Caudoviricetes sp.]